MAKRVTIVEVARATGLDNSTVSLALRGDRRIAEQTRLRIADVARRLNYVPNQLASALSSGRSRVIGVMLPGMENQFFAPHLEEFQAAAERSGNAIAIKFCDWDSQREEAGLLQFCSSRVDGLIWCPAGGSNEQLKATADKLHAARMPFVILGGPSKMGHLVGTAEGAALKLGAEYLVGLGHRRIGIATATRVPGLRGALHRNRVLQLREALLAAGARVDAADIFETGDNEYGGVEFAVPLRERAPFSRPTAIYAADDMLARALVMGLRVAGIGVPSGVSVLGFDDAPRDASGPVPITSVSLEARGNGRAAIALLLDVIAGKVPPSPFKTIRLSPKIVERASCTGIS